MVKDKKELTPTRERTETILFRCKPDLKEAMTLTAEMEKRSVADLMRLAIAERIQFKGEL